MLIICKNSYCTNPPQDIPVEHERHSGYCSACITRYFCDCNCGCGCTWEEHDDIARTGGVFSSCSDGRGCW